MTGLDQAKRQGRRNLLTALFVILALIGLAILLFTVRSSWGWIAAFTAVTLVYLLWLVMYGSRLLRGIPCPHCQNPLMAQIPDSNEARLLAFFIPAEVTKCLSCGGDLTSEVKESV